MCIIILGDGATLQCVEKIWKKLTEMKFAASNVAFGCDAFAMTAVFEKDKMIINTRDTWNMACKATYCVINGKEYPIFKDPKTDSGMKNLTGDLYMFPRMRMVTSNMLIISI